MTFLESIGLVSNKKEFIPHQKRERQGTKEYKNGSMYLYCTPEDKEIAQRLSKEQGISMKELIHNLMVDADGDGMTDAEPGTGDDEIRVITSDKITVMTAGDFFEEFVFGPMERWEQLKQERVGDKK
jgi:hypothetical protein